MESSNNNENNQDTVQKIDEEKSPAIIYPPQRKPRSNLTIYTPHYVPLQQKIGSPQYVYHEFTLTKKNHHEGKEDCLENENGSQIDLGSFVGDYEVNNNDGTLVKVFSNMNNNINSSYNQNLPLVMSESLAEPSGLVKRKYTKRKLKISSMQLPNMKQQKVRQYKALKKNFNFDSANFSLENGEDKNEVIKAAKALFSKRTRTLYHWMKPEKTKMELKNLVATKWETLPEQEKQFYISQVLGRFGFPSTNIMINPQIQRSFNSSCNLKQNYIEEDNLVNLQKFNFNISANEPSIYNEENFSSNSLNNDLSNYSNVKISFIPMLDSESYVNENLETVEKCQSDLNEKNPVENEKAIKNTVEHCSLEFESSNKNLENSHEEGIDDKIENFNFQQNEMFKKDLITQSEIEEIENSIQKSIDALSSYSSDFPSPGKGSNPNSSIVTDLKRSQSPTDKVKVMPVSTMKSENFFLSDSKIDKNHSGEFQFENDLNNLQKKLDESQQLDVNHELNGLVDDDMDY